jgi:hypothetical protein
MVCLSAAAEDGGTSTQPQTCDLCVTTGNPCGADNDCCNGTCDPTLLECN